MTEGLIAAIDNGSSEITIGDKTCMFKLISYRGFAAADYSVSMSSGGAADGGYITSARLDSRTLELKFDFGGSYGEKTRQSLISFFSPHKELKVTAYRGKIIRTITGRSIDFDISETNKHARSIVSLSILCPDPYFKAINAIYQGAATAVPAFLLPCHVPCILGIQSNSNSLTIYNGGDVPADMTAELTAYSEVVNPYIANDTNGKKILIKDSLNSGDKLTISTVRRQKMALINGNRCLIDPSSQFSDFLEVGENNIRYSFGANSSDIAISIQCTALYLGV